MLRAVLDPGVLIAAIIKPNGVCGRLLQACLDGQVTLVASPQLLGELEVVLLRSKFRPYLSEQEAVEYADSIRGIAEIHRDIPVHGVFTPDPKDDYLVALARDANAHYLISGDPHLTGLIDPEPPVLTPRAFLEKLINDP